ncbi:Maf-domain-containing protein [Xylona heveae TC161]|uniref:Maf-domain-containing protein n=1 Tax=Xylona heveae (strain CBS 132557 / TC161) TaxID=1328760 RepID=A0A165GDZ3_XYLHT|nr:Maf-domain-containing protein [Xylona heveae TC161]KZF22077.1 Maf-domain-containing protein [Xylona heveae TC161]
MTDAKYEKAPQDAPPSYETSEQQATRPAIPPPGAPLKGPLRAPFPLDIPELNFLRDKRVILASASPRRKMLLAQIGLHNLDIVPSTVPENLPKSLSPFEYVRATATQKAMTVYTQEINNAERGEPALVLAADTVVVGHLGDIFEKPRSEREHIDMLKGLRDFGEHKVYTAVVAMAPLESARDPGYALETAVEETTVKFSKDVSDDLILAYVRTREGADKAGGYGIQGIGSILVERIDGTFDNVVGLPLRATLNLIRDVLKSDEELQDEAAEAENDDELVDL